MPPPSSLTWIRLLPPSCNSTSMRVAPASMLFSTSSLTAAAGRSITSPAAMRLTRVGGSSRMSATVCLALAGEIAARQYLALFDRRLVERVNADQARRQDGLEH